LRELGYFFVKTNSRTFYDTNFSYVPAKKLNEPDKSDNTACRFCSIFWEWAGLHLLYLNKQSMKVTKNTPLPATLVLGGNGKTGRKVAERLSKLNIPVRIGSRRGSSKM
jgi:hypothetical protein